MNLALFLPIAVSLAIPLVLATFRRDEHSDVEGVLTYRWPIGFAYFFLAGYSLLAFLLPYLPLVFPDRSGKYPVANLPLSLAVLLVGTLLAIYIFRFRVVLEKTAVRSGAFLSKSICYSEIVSVSYVERAKQLIVRASSGKRIRIAGTLGDFASLVVELEHRLPEGQSMPREAPRVIP